VLLSTDHVFPGDAAPYDESFNADPSHAGSNTVDDGPGRVPVNVYGRTKADAECALRAALPARSWAILRVSMVHGPPGPPRRQVHVHPSSATAETDPAAGGPLLPGSGSFAQGLRAMVTRDGGCALFADQRRCPVHVADVAAAVTSIVVAVAAAAGGHRSDNPEPQRPRGEAHLLPERCAGVFNVGGPESLSRLEMGRALAAALSLDTAAITAGSTSDISFNTGPLDATMTIDRLRRELQVNPATFADTIASAFDN
jgi:nucleoside-diphosphate-sugar epimerase